jgi:hypothetical protein
MSARDVVSSDGAISISAGTYHDRMFNAWVYDLTILKAAGQRILSRFKDGVPVCDLYLSLRHLDLMIGDPVSFTSPVPVGKGYNGADSTVKWEVVSTELLVDTTEPCVKVRVAMLSGPTDYADDFELTIEETDVTLDVVTYPWDAPENARTCRLWVSGD